MQLEFSKYQGTGNDFVLIDNRNNIISHKNTEIIEKLCHRRFGVGADGLMLLENEDGYDFRMRYFNSDGKEASMCGNGGRCIVAFAYHLGIISSETKFIAVDGEHDAKVSETESGLNVSLKMINVDAVEKGTDFFYLNTGSPHFVKLIESHKNFNTFEEGKKIRYNDRFKSEGTNVNFVSLHDKHIEVSTYERGVEDETYSCGTGVVASAISCYYKTNTKKFDIITKGGRLNVTFDNLGRDTFNNIWLTGPATLVFKGEIDV